MESIAAFMIHWMHSIDDFTVTASECIHVYCSLIAVMNYKYLRFSITGFIIVISDPYYVQSNTFPHVINVFCERWLVTLSQ